MDYQKYRIIIRAQADADLDNIFQYILWASLDVNVANSFVTRIENAINSIAHFPRTFPRMIEDNLYEKGYRKLVFANYIVPFTIDEETKTVNIMRVLHGRMDYQKFL